MEEAFKHKLKEDRSFVNLNWASFSKEKYEEVIKKVIIAKKKIRNKQPFEYHLLKKYAVVETDDGRKRLIVPKNDPDANTVYYVHDDDLFEILQKTHVSLDHGGRDKMMRELRKNYKNITYKDIKMFLNLCQKCINKTKRDKKEPISYNQLNSICQIDLIDYRSYPDDEYNFLMVYQQKSTKFCLLKPVKAIDAKEVANHLIDIFTLIGVPNTLQSNQGDNFMNSVINHLKSLWKDLEIANALYDGNIESKHQQIETMITKWMRYNMTSKWSKGLPFVQFKKNTTFDPTIHKSPYEALFRRPPTVEPSQKDEQDSNSVEEPEVSKMEPSDYDDNGQIEEEMIEIFKTENEDPNICEICGNEMEQAETVCSMCAEIKVKTEY